MRPPVGDEVVAHGGAEAPGLVEEVVDRDGEVDVVPGAEAEASVQVEDVVVDGVVLYTLHECLGVVSAEVYEFEDVVDF